MDVILHEAGDWLTAEFPSGTAVGVGLMWLTPSFFLVALKQFIFFFKAWT